MNIVFVIKRYVQFRYHKCVRTKRYRCTFGKCALSVRQCFELALGITPQKLLFRVVII